MDHEISIVPRHAEQEFEQLFKTHFKGLHAYATTMVRDSEAAEDLVQQTFLKLWERRSALAEIDAPAAYLYRSVYNSSINYQKHVKVKAAFEQYAARQQAMPASAADTPAPAGVRELEQRIDLALKELPEQCRTIFQMSRFEDLKYREIAAKLGLSVKTVEAQMGKALRIMRMKLTDYLPAALITLLLLY